MTVNAANAEIRLTLEAASEPVTGSYRVGGAQSGRFRGLLELIGALERARSKGLNHAASSSSAPDVPAPTEA